MAIDIVKQGFLTTVQDEGRFTLQQYGINVGGAMDCMSYRIANMLLQQSNCAALEMTLIGPIVEFSKATEIAITGANFCPLLNGKPCPMWRPVQISKGDVLQFCHAKDGVRGYLAVKGGITLKPQLYSRSTHLHAGFGGFEGRALKRGDVLPYTQYEGKPTPRWSVDARTFVRFEQAQVIRIIEGIDIDFLTVKSRKQLTEKTFTVSNNSDRMGYRLQASEPFTLQTKANILSEAVAFGTVQLPPNGEPIVLMADRQTIGGYPKIAQVIAVDLPKVAQLKPGATIRFELVSYDEAQRLFFARERALHLLQMTIGQK